MSCHPRSANSNMNISNCFRSNSISNLSGINYTDNDPEDPVLLPGDFSLRTSRIDEEGEVLLGFRTLRQGPGVTITEVNNDNSLLISGSTTITDTPDNPIVPAASQNNQYHSQPTPGNYLFRGLVMDSNIVNNGRDTPIVPGYNSLGWNYASSNPLRYAGRTNITGATNVTPITPINVFSTNIHSTSAPIDTTPPNYSSPASTALFPTQASPVIIPPVTTYYNISASLTVAIITQASVGESFIVVLEIIDGGGNILQLSSRSIGGTGENITETIELNGSLLLNAGAPYRLRSTVRAISTTINSNSVSFSGHLAISELI